MITREELRRLSNINREISRLKRRAEELRSFAEGSGSKITGLPHASDPHSRETVMAMLADYTVLVDNKITESVEAYTELLDFIDSVHDAVMRDILYYRHVECMSWVQVAFTIRGGMHSADALRKRHDRFIHGKTA